MKVCNVSFGQTLFQSNSQNSLQKASSKMFGDVITNICDVINLILAIFSLEPKT